MNQLVPSVSLALLVSFAFTGCETPGQSALTGAAAGAAIGGLATGHGDGALVGAAIGAGTGYLVGRQVQAERRAAYDAGYYDARNEARDYRDDGGYREDRSYRGHYPSGRLTDRAGFVISPYYPYSRIDVRGIPRGAQVEDPSTHRIFINP
jgi:hypothetical protein